MDATSAQCNKAIQAVDVYLTIDGKEVRAIIPREVFEGRLRSPDGPEAWLKSYEDNAARLNAIIRKRFAAKPQDFVVVRLSDFGPNQG